MLSPIKAIIFDWGRTLFDSETWKEFPEAEKVLEACAKRGYKMACVSLVSPEANATHDERKQQIESSPLRKFFQFVSVTDKDKDLAMDLAVNELNFSREQILIVDDRIVKGVKYGNLHGHPTVWLQSGRFANELPNEETKQPTFIIHSLSELTDII